MHSEKREMYFCLYVDPGISQMADECMPGKLQGGVGGQKITYIMIYLNLIYYPLAIWNYKSELISNKQ